MAPTPDQVRSAVEHHCQHWNDRDQAAWEALFAASPDAAFTTEEIVEAGDRVVARWRYDYGDGHVRGVDLFTVRDGRVAEKLSYVKG